MDMIIAEEVALKTLISMVNRELNAMKRNISILTADTVLIKGEYFSGMIQDFIELAPEFEDKALQEWEPISEQFLKLAEIVRKYQ